MNQDRKMAEEYICNGKCQDDITRNYVHCKSCTRIKDFLAGLNAGRPKWHDLRKDPNDLPKVDQKVLLQIKDENEPITDFCRREGIWNFANKYEAVAWCEIPKYTEEV